MSDAMNIPQLTAVPSPAASRGDEARAAPDTPAVAADAVPRSFGEVLKSKATPKTEPTSEEAAESARPQVIQEDTSFLSVISVIPVPIENPLAPQVLAQLKGDAPGALQSSMPPVSATADPAQLQLAVLPSPRDIPTETPMLAAPTIPVTLSALPTPSVPSPSSAPLTVASAVLPAPTLAPGRGQERGLTTTASAGRPLATATEVNADDRGRRPMLAASPAISAEPGDTLLPEVTAEFRPLLDRLTEHAGTITTQTAPSQAPSQQLPAAPVQMRMATPFAQAGWAQEIDQKLTWMVTNTRQQADLVINPPDLGRIEVTLVVKGDEVNASFASPHQAVREAIEESLVRLRESLAESGINLGQTHVGRDSSRDAAFMKQDGEARQGNGSRRETGVALGVPLSSGTAWQPSRSRGMVDVFA